MLKHCNHCGKEFTDNSTNHRKRYCSLECRPIERNGKMIFKPLVIVNPCRECGREITNRGKSKYCSDWCKGKSTARQRLKHDVKRKRVGKSIVGQKVPVFTEPSGRKTVILSKTIRDIILRDEPERKRIQIRFDRRKEAREVFIMNCF